MEAVDFVLETLSHFTKCDDSPPPGISSHPKADFERTLVELCESHGMAPIVLSSLEKLALTPELSRVAIERLRHSVRSIREQGERVTTAAEAVGDVFSNERIHHLFTGGYALSRILYPSMDYRFVDQVDVVIRETDWPLAAELLQNLGFHHSFHAAALKEPEKVLSFCHYIAPCLFHNDRGEVIRVKFRLFDCGPPEKEEPSWRRRNADYWGEVGFDTVTREDHLMDAVLEWNMGKFSALALLCDIGLILHRFEHNFDWTYITRRLVDKGFYPSFYFSLEHAAKLLAMPSALNRLDAPHPFKRKMFELIWHPHEMDVFAAGARRRRFMKRHLLGCGSASARMAILKKWLNPDPEWVSAFFGRPYKRSMKMKFVALTLTGKSAPVFEAERDMNEPSS